MLKLWFLTTEYPPFFGGGIGTYMRHAAQMFAGAGHEVTVFVPDKENVEYQQANRIRVVRFRSGSDDLGEEAPGPEPDDHPAFPFNIMSYWPALSYSFALKVRQFIEREGPPDFIEVQDYGGIGYYLLQQKWLGYNGLLDVPVIMHLHTPSFEILPLDQYPSYRLPEYWVGRMERFSIIAADARICPSRFLKRKVTATVTGGRDDLDIEVIPLPFKQEEELTAAEPEEKVLVYVGRLELRKGVLPLVETCHRLWEQGEQFRLVLVGGDTEFYTKGMSVGEYLRKRYDCWVEDGRLEFTGNLNPKQCAGQVSRAWAVVIPSLYENFPLTCVEAMQAGKPVIVSSSGGQAEMVGNVDCGRVFNWDESGSLERSIKEVMHLTPSEIKAMGNRARSRIRELTGYKNVLPLRMAVFDRLKNNNCSKTMFPSANRFDPWPAFSEAPVDNDSVPELLSVVIPYYNMGSYIDETLESVLNSTYRPVEVVIVNDGSDNPESLAKLREIENSGRKEVRIIHTENKGLASARNTGARYARGEFLALLDADDLVEPEFYARSIKILKKYKNVSLVYSWVRYFDGAKGCFIANNLEFPYLLAHNMLAAICVLKRADFLAFALNKPVMSYGLEDYEGWISLYESGRLGVCIPEFLTSYRVRPNSMARGMNHNQVLCMYDEIVRLHPESYRHYGDELFRLLNTNGASCVWNAPGDNWQSAEIRLRWYEQEVLRLNKKIEELDRQAKEVYIYPQPQDLGLKTALRALGFGIKRKTKELLKKLLFRG